MFGEQTFAQLRTSFRLTHTGFGQWSHRLLAAQGHRFPPDGTVETAGIRGDALPLRYRGSKAMLLAHECKLGHISLLAQSKRQTCSFHCSVDVHALSVNQVLVLLTAPRALCIFIIWH